MTEATAGQSTLRSVCCWVTITLLIKRGLNIKIKYHWCIINIKLIISLSDGIRPSWSISVFSTSRGFTVCIFLNIFVSPYLFVSHVLSTLFSKPLNLCCSLNVILLPAKLIRNSTDAFILHSVITMPYNTDMVYSLVNLWGPVEFWLCALILAESIIKNLSLSRFVCPFADRYVRIIQCGEFRVVI
jgi:hypothetical protein